MADCAGAFSEAAESAAKLAAGEAFRSGLSCDAGGNYSFFITSNEAGVVEKLCTTAVTLYGIYTASKLIARAIDGIVFRSLGGGRDDQGISEIKPGSLHVKLKCFTDERFLQVWVDYQSGRIKERLQEEFSQSGIKVEGLKIEIENFEEVHDIKTRIESRSGKNNPDKISGRRNDCEHLKEALERKLEEMNKKLEEIKENQLRIGAYVKDSFENFRKDIIDEIKISLQEKNNSPSKRPVVQRKVQTSLPKSQSCEVFVLGGTGKDHIRTASVEKMVLGQGELEWVGLAPMAEPRSHPTSVTINNQIVIVGGGTNSVEIMDFGQQPLRWVKSKTVLPFLLFGHQTVVYRGKLIVIGGYDASKGTYSDEINEVSLKEPFTTKLLCTLPKPRGYHGAELVNEKVFIFGGKRDGGLYDDVLEYDPVKNTCEQVSQLPHPLRYMSTVLFENKVILIGGEKEDYIPSRGVLLYDTESRKCCILPPMKHARRGCAAVYTGDVMVVMGGYGNKGPTKSVECYDFTSMIWRDLPAMNVARGHATAIVM